MSLTPGTKLGHYEIRSLLGAGGMGEVYLAEDAKLERKVALKTLPAEVAANADRMCRFVQEAKAASSLNHPHIITIYDIDESADPPFIATEYIDGETLRKRLSNGPLRLIDALEVTIQLASALASAHAAGIVHRDIKPENIMLRGDGYAKVLDFGLAKLAPHAAAVDSEAATRNLVKTDPGAVMGTVSYMSPEQARGMPVDARTDLWSLGVVLYEMSTGKVPFVGETATDVILAVVDREPIPLSRQSGAFPEALEWIVAKALTKDREDRYQTAREMMTDLRRLKQRVEVSTEFHHSAPPEPAAPFTSTQTQNRSTAPPVGVSTVSSAEYIVGQIKNNKRTVFSVLGVLVLALAGAGYAVYRFGAFAPASEGGRAMKITRLTSDGVNGATSISPDGKYVAYSPGPNDQKSLWVRQTATNSAVQIVPPAAGSIRGTTFSPDGNHVYYTWVSAQNAEGMLFEIPTLGGTPRPLLSGIKGAVSFSPDGKRIAFVRGEASLMAANVDGSDIRMLLDADHATEWLSGDGPAWSPDGRVIVLGKGSSVGGLKMNLVEVPADGGEARPVTSHTWLGDISRSVWLKDGTGLIVAASERFSQGTQIWFLAYPDGQPRRITNDLNGYGTFSLGVTDDGSTIVTVQEERTNRIWKAALGDDDGRAQKLSNEKYDGQPEWAPDGRIVFVRNSGGNVDVWIMNADGGGQRQLTHDAALDYDVAVTPDGRYIVYASDRSGLPHIWRMNLDGSDARQLTFGDTFDDGNPAVTPDGKWVIYNSWQTGRWSPRKVSIDGGQPQQLFVGQAAVGAVSPDGQTVVCQYLDERTQPAQWRAALFPTGGGEAVKLFDLEIPRGFAEDGVGWSADGKSIYFISDDNVYALPVAGGKPKQVTDLKAESLFYMSVSSDGKRFALARGQIADDVVLIRDFR
jgi:eukaryotic-like serine/threonine-protein kinase